MPTFTTLITDKLPASALLDSQHQVITPFTPQGHLPIPLTQGVCLRFQLIPNSDGITAIRLRFGTYCRHNQAHITVTLTAQTTCEVRFPASVLSDNQFIDFDLPMPLVCIPNEPVTIAIYSADATPDNAVAVWCSRALPTFLQTLQLKTLYFPKTAMSGDPMVDGSRVSIVIPIFNKVLYTYNCLLTVQACDQQISKEVIIVNNASSDDTKWLLAHLLGAVKIINNPDNLGFVQACRQGADLAAGEFILFLNNDTQVTPGWLDSMVAMMESDPTIGITGSKLIYPNGQLQEAGGIIFNDASGCNYGRYQDPTDPRYNQPRPIDYCSGASLMIRKTLWDSLGGFDLRFAPAYYEDTDLCFAARRAGYQVCYCPDSEVIHHEGITAGTDVQTGYKAYQVLNHKKFRTKWRNMLTAYHLPPATSSHIAAQRLVTATSTFRIPSQKIIACHLFGQGWAANFWSYLNLSRLEADLNLITSLGFNTVILLIPWVGFQTHLSPITYYEEYFTLFKQLLDKLQTHGLQVILRLGYTHDNGPASEPEGYLRQIVIGADEATWQAWSDYLDRLWHIVQLYPKVLGGFITWEDFFLMDLTHIPSAQRLFYATATGYQAYLSQHYSLDLVSTSYQQTFSSFAEVPIPPYKGHGIQLFCEFWDDLLINKVFKPSKSHFPPLAMEVRIDCEPEGSTGLHICHHQTFDLTADSFVTMIYYSPAWGAPNDGQSETAESILTRMRWLFEHLQAKTGNVIFIDQFNFIDNTPGFEHNTGIIPEQIPAFLTGATRLLQEYSIGYGLWTLRDVPANALRNGLFAHDYPAWEITQGEIIVDPMLPQTVACLQPGGRLSQTVTHCWGVPLLPAKPFQLDYQGRPWHTGEVTIAMLILDAQRQVVNEQVSTWSGTDWTAIHLGSLPFAKGYQLQVENRGTTPVLLSNFYLYQLRQENGIIDANGQPKPFYENLLQLNQHLATGSIPPPKSYFRAAEITPQTFTGVFSDFWMGQRLTGLVTRPATSSALSFIVKAYIPEHWVNYQNHLTLKLAEPPYQDTQLVHSGYNEIIFVFPLSWSTSNSNLAGDEAAEAIIEFELIAAMVYSSPQYDPESSDNRKLSMQLLELGWVN